MEINVQPMKVAKVMLSIIAVLAVMHITQLSLFLYINDSDVFDWIRMLDFDEEGNLPSLYSSLAIAFCALLLWIITKSEKTEGRAYWHWLGLSLIFVYLAFDEGFAIHEEIGDFTEDYIDASGYLYFAWVVPYGILGILFIISYMKFLFRIPKDIAIQFVIAGSMFVLGAVVLEVISAKEADLHDTYTVKYSVLYTIEELLEMISMVVFANALLKYMGRTIKTINMVLHS